MITRENVLAMESPWTPDKYTMDEAGDVLGNLNVEDPYARVEWFNAVTLDVDDIVLLANVRFHVLTCDGCGDQILIGEPENWDYFQGVLQGEYGPVTIDDREILVCDTCYDYLTYIGR